MEYVLSGLVVAFLVALVIGALRGSVNVRSCCSIADPRRDARMRDAYSEDQYSDTPDADVAIKAGDRATQAQRMDPSESRMESSLQCADVNQ